MSMGAPIVVVGAGFGGLAAAVALAKRGEEVVLFDASSEVGGKARAVTVGGGPVDVGPTVLTMRWVFDELFRSAGAELERAVELQPLDVIARHHFADGSVLDLFPEVERSAAAIEKVMGAREAAAYLRFASYAEEIAQVVEGPFMTATRPTFSSLLRDAGKMGLGALLRIDAHRTMWNALGGYFHDERLRALFARYATYVGSSPLEAPATFNLISHVERSGVFAVRGGVSALARAVADLARSLGVRIELGTAVREIVTSGGRAVGVRIQRPGGEDEVVRASAVIANADVATLANGTFGKVAATAVEAPPPRERSLSAVTWALAVEASGFELAHHNVFFSRDYHAETTQLWTQRVLPSEPTVYVAAPATEDGRTRLFVIANAPPRDFGVKEIDECERRMFGRLEQAGLKLKVLDRQRTTPADFAARAPGTAGAIYGAAAHGPLHSLLRPGARTKMRGLYVAGGSVHPGPGVPMAALSGRAAVTELLRDLSSTGSSLRPATSGSTSML